MLEKDFTSHQEALELKELGFDEPCIGFYKLGDVDIYYGTIIQEKNHKFRNNTGLNIYGDLKEKIAAPTYSQAFRWFREKHKLNSETPYLPNVEKYGIVVSDMTIKPKDLANNENLKRGAEVTNNFSQYETHEEAELACLRKMIEIIKRTRHSQF